MARDFNAVVFRIIVFVSSIPKANVTLTINGFPAKQSHYFEKEIEDIIYSEELKKAIRCEIYPESAY